MTNSTELSKDNSNSLNVDVLALQTTSTETKSASSRPTSSPRAVSKGKRKFNKKKVGGTKSNLPPVSKQFIPENLYISQCCNALGKKKRVIRPQGVKPKDPTTYGQESLGKFRCTQCNKPAKFNRTKNTEGVPLQA